MNTKFISTTAVLLALTLIFQSLRLITPMPQLLNQYLIGSLVNLCLIVAAVIVGIKGGLVLAIVAPVVAYIQGFMPQFPIMIVLVALGNSALVIAVALISRKNRIASYITGAVLKFVVLFIGVVRIAVPFLLANAPDKVKGALSVQFSWPQLLTAIIGSILAIAIIPLLEKQ